MKIIVQPYVEDKGSHLVAKHKAYFEGSPEIFRAGLSPAEAVFRLILHAGSSQGISMQFAKAETTSKS